MEAGGAGSPTSIHATCSSCAVPRAGFSLVPQPKGLCHTLSEGPVVSSAPDVPARNWSTLITYLKWSSALVSSERNHFCMLKTVVRAEPLHDERGVTLRNGASGLNQHTSVNAASTGYLAV